jgi:hypothetical protein
VETHTLHYPLKSFAYLFIKSVLQVVSFLFDCVSYEVMNNIQELAFKYVVVAAALGVVCFFFLLNNKIKKNPRV